MSTLIDYWYYTGDDSWNEDVMTGIQFQTGDESDFMPRNQTKVEGNDDQGFWGFTAMNAAELGFPDPPDDKPGWATLAMGVFNTQAARWDTEHCNGGLRWQIFSWNDGYDYKNTISAACFFALGSRLALYTGNESYAEWAETTWDWTTSVGYIDDDYQVYDGAHITDNCNELTPYQWTYNAGAFLLGAAAMYNHTEDKKWKDRVDGLIDGLDIFFEGDDNNLMTEVACEPTNSCNMDQQSFKAYLSRYMTMTVKWYPETADKIMPLLRASSIIAAKQCTGGDNDRMCGLKWHDDGKWDGSTGLGQQMAAVQVSLANLIEKSADPVTLSTGGTSDGNPAAGGNDIGRVTTTQWGPMSTSDKAGAGIVTAVIMCLLVAAVCFMMSDDVRDAAASGSITGALGYYPAAGRLRRRTVDMGNIFPLEKTGSVRSRIEKTGSVTGSGMLLNRGSGMSPTSPRAAPAVPYPGSASPRPAPPTPREVPATPGQWLDAAAAAGNIGRASPGPNSPSLGVPGPSSPRPLSPGSSVAGPSSPMPLSPGAGIPERSNTPRLISPLQEDTPQVPRVPPGPPGGAWLDIPPGAQGEGRISWPGGGGNEEVWAPSNRQRLADN